MTFSYFYSNRAEKLYEHFLERVFVGDPFARRLVLVPSPAMKTWLMTRLASDLGIAAGLEVAFLEQGLLRLADDGQGRTPSRTELSLAIEWEIDQIMDRYAQLSHVEQQMWQQPWFYLQQSGRKRKISLADRLADLFLQYGIYGRMLLQKWKQEPVKNWQQVLWLQLEKRFERWKYPAKIFEQPSTIASTPKTLQIHLFAMSFIPKLHHDFLTRLIDRAAVAYYLLSPCEAFWSDLLSDKQRIYVRRKEEKKGTSAGSLLLLDELLRDTNPLLANFGRLGRVMAQYIEDSPFGGICDYEELPPTTLLQQLQADLLQLRNPEADPPQEWAGDRSLQIHCAPSAYREIEIVYHQLLALIDENQKKGLTILPEDILVMAPDIMEYVPFIKGVFGDGESLLHYQIMDVQMPAGDPTVEAFIHLLRLPQGRWQVEEVLVLLDSTAFCQKHGLSLEEAARIRRWVDESPVQWGIDEKHRQTVLKEAYQTEESAHVPAFTWAQSTRWLVENWICPPRFQEEEGTVLQNVDGDLLGRWLDLLHSLRKDLRPLTTGATKSLREWALLLQDLLERYFAPQDSDGFRVLGETIKELSKASTTLTEAVYPYESLLRRLESALTKEKISYRENQLHAVKFCSLLPMRAIPAKIIVWMGMQEGAFPRQENRDSLNLLAADADYCPGKTDFDRYLFLETLLSVRHTFLITYQGQSLEACVEVPPSLVVAELLDYLDKGYRIGGEYPSQVLVKKHSIDSYQPCYFQCGSQYVNYSQRDFHAASYKQGEVERKKHAFIQPLAIHYEKEPEENIELKELEYFASNPLRTYLKNLGITLPEENHIPDPFEMSALEKSRLAKLALKSSWEYTLEVADRQGSWPAGLLKQLTLEGLAEGVEQTKAFFKGWGWDAPPKKLKWILARNCREPKQLSSDIWQLPALQWEGLLLTGVIDGITECGLLVDRKRDKTQAIKSLPTMLAYATCIDRYALPYPQKVLFQRDGKELVLETLSHQEILRRYLHFYLEGRHRPVLLEPEWLEEYLSGHLEQLTAHIKKRCVDPFRPLYNRYITWAFPEGEFTLDPLQYETSRLQANAIYRDFLTLLEESKEKRGRKK